MSAPYFNLCAECEREQREHPHRVVLVVEREGSRVRLHCATHLRLVLDAEREAIELLEPDTERAQGRRSRCAS